jgi:ubiquinone/menaquinone biosynthesis C-methylase UbiE
MLIQTRPRRKRRPAADPAASPPRTKVFNRIVEHPLIKRLPFAEYRNKVRKVYDGPQGAVLEACSFLSLHLLLGERLFRQRRFDLRGARRILDVGSGAGQMARHVVRYADPQAIITCFDLSYGMVLRAIRRLNSAAPSFVVADLSQLPFADETFDCVTCGYVLEHLPDPRIGLSELWRVLTPGGRMLLLTTEDNFSGACTSRMWRCRTYNRRELYTLMEQTGLRIRQELWFTPLHKWLRAGGICVELEKPRSRDS